MDAFTWDIWILLEAFLFDFFFQNYLEHFTDHKPSLSGRYFILVGSLISVKRECTGHDTW